MTTDKKVETDKVVETLEDEFKLIKGELKETLSSVRDYLLNSELPASEYAQIMQAIGIGGGGQSLTGKLSLDMSPTAPEPMQEEIIEETLPEAPVSQPFQPDEPSVPESEMSQEEEPAEQDEPIEPESELSQEEKFSKSGEPIASESELPYKEEFGEPGEPPVPQSELPQPQMEYRQVSEEVNQSIPRVNLLANLTHWVSNAKKEIGMEQLPVFLEVYGITGHLSPELKDVILHMADITLEQLTEASASEIWSKLMLELHGILTGGDAPRYPVRPFWNGNEEEEEEEEEIQPVEAELEVEEDKPKDKPLKLKLVLSKGDDEEKEFCIDLNPGEDEDSP